MTEPDWDRARELIKALQRIREEWGCACISASYVSPDGQLLTVIVYHEFVTVGDDSGNVHAIALSSPELAE